MFQESQSKLSSEKCGSVRAVSASNEATQLVPMSNRPRSACSASCTWMQFSTSACSIPYAMRKNPADVITQSVDCCDVMVFLHYYLKCKIYGKVRKYTIQSVAMQTNTGSWRSGCRSASLREHVVACSRPIA